MNSSQFPTDETLDRLLSGVKDRVRADARRKERRHRLVVAGGIGVMAMVLTGAGIAVHQATTQEKSVSTCFASASLRAKSTGVSAVPSDGRVPDTVPDMQDRVTLAEEMCAAVWRLGFFHDDTPPNGDARQDHVPTLTACMLPDGRLGVFPTDTDAARACADLGLQRPS